MTTHPLILSHQMQDHLPPGISIVKSDNLEEWQMDIKVLDDNPIYKDQTYRLKFTFNNKYPIGKIHTKPHPSTQPSTPSPTAPANPPRTPGSAIHRTPHLIRHSPPDPNAPPHLQQRHHLPRSARLLRLVPRADSRERLHEHPEYADS